MPPPRRSAATSDASRSRAARVAGPRGPSAVSVERGRHQQRGFGGGAEPLVAVAHRDDDERRGDHREERPARGHRSGPSSRPRTRPAPAPGTSTTQPIVCQASTRVSSASSFVWSSGSVQAEHAQLAHQHDVRDALDVLAREVDALLARFAAPRLLARARPGARSPSSSGPMSRRSRPSTWTGSSRPRWWRSC